MVYIEKWGAFESQAKALFTSQPQRTRHVIKYSPDKHILRVKVTDDVVCLQYRTDKDADVRRVTRLVQWFAEQVATSASGAAAQ